MSYLSGFVLSGWENPSLQQACELFRDASGWAEPSGVLRLGGDRLQKSDIKRMCATGIADVLRFGVGCNAVHRALGSGRGNCCHMARGYKAEPPRWPESQRSHLSEA